MFVIWSQALLAAAITTSMTLAPTQKYSPSFHTTMPRKSFSARAVASCSIWMTSGSMLLALVLNVRPRMPSPRSHASAPSFLSTGAPPLRACASVISRGSVARFSYSFLSGFQTEPSSL